MSLLATNAAILAVDARVISGGAGYVENGRTAAVGSSGTPKAKAACTPAPARWCEDG